MGRWEGTWAIRIHLWFVCGGGCCDLLGGACLIHLEVDDGGSRGISGAVTGDDHAVEDTVEEMIVDDLAEGVFAPEDGVGAVDLAAEEFFNVRIAQAGAGLDGGIQVQRAIPVGAYGGFVGEVVEPGALREVVAPVRLTSSMNPGRNFGGYLSSAPGALRDRNVRWPSKTNP